MTVKVREGLVGRLSLSRPQLSLSPFAKGRKDSSSVPRGPIPRAACDFYKFSFIYLFFSFKPSGTLERSLIHFRVFFLEAKDEFPGEEPYLTLKVMGV